MSLLLSLVAVCAVYYAIKKLTTNTALEEFYEKTPCPGRKPERFSWLRATLRSVFDTPERVAEGYEKVSTSDESLGNKRTVADISFAVWKGKSALPGP
jgi:hypothetical protein